MPTIKTKRTMKAREFIVFGIKNNIKNLIVNAINEECREKAIIHFDSNAMPIVSENVCPYHMFEVEIEEEITEDTVLPELVTRTVKGHYGLWKKGSINSFKHITFNDVEAFYVPNDDLTMTLIWTKEKGLVE